MTNLTYGNRGHIAINDANSYGDTILIGNGADDSVLANSIAGAAITLGNGTGDSVNELGYLNTITLGGGSGDIVYTTDSGNDIITLGNGAGDFVRVDNSNHDTVTLGNGRGDSVNIDDERFYGLPGNNTVTLGNGAGDTVIAQLTSADTIKLGNGNHDVVNAQISFDDSITVGNGNDTILPGTNTTMAVGTGHDSFIFSETNFNAIGQAVITGFDPHKDSITFSNQLTTSVSYHDDAHGNAVIAVDGYADTITLNGVHAAQLHPADFHFVDDPAAAIAQHLQQIADHHAAL